MGLDLLQRLTAIRGIQDIVAFTEDIAQNHLIDALVLHDEDIPFQVQDFRVLICREDGLCGGLGVLPRNGAHPLQQLLFLIHQPVGALEYIVETGVRSGLIL